MKGISLEYSSLLEKLKKDIQETQLRAIHSATKELISLYWRMGRLLVINVEKAGWGNKVIEQLARDIANAFPGITGFSYRNFYFMKQFAESYPQGISETAVSQIPWGHNIILLQKIQSSKERLWYAEQSVEHGWSRSMLMTWIESDLFNRQGKAITNFRKTLPPLQSDMAEQILKDPYNLQFMTLEASYREKELEQGLIEHLQKFLVELGEGFAFMGRQYRIEVEGEDHWIDLLFYHVKLRCYIVIELKATSFDPRDAGQMNFYLSAVDDLLKHPQDQPSMGILLCKTKNQVKVEYALRGCSSPIGVSSYETKIMKSLPKNLRSKLPTVEEIEAELSRPKSLKKKVLSEVRG